MSDLVLSRVRLRPEPAVASLAPLLLDSSRGDADHRLVWSLFGRTGEEKRDFLFRRTARDEFLILSRSEPVDGNGLFRIDSKPFRPQLAAGEELAFSLLANPVVTRTGPDGRRGKRHDVAMARLHAVPKGERAAVRAGIERAAGLAWLVAQGARHGFTLAARPCERDEAPDEGAGDGLRFAVSVERRPQIVVGRGHAKKPATVTPFHFEGRLRVNDPAALTAALAQGLGKAKAYGLGLLLIRRV